MLGAQLGIMPIISALQEAEKQNLDLVEIAPAASPPVCKIVDYGKFLYAEQKGIKRQKSFELKEIKFRPTIDTHDFVVKINKILAFLNEGHKVKVSLKFKGREITHKELGVELFKRIQTTVSHLGSVDAGAKMEGYQMIMIISPKKKSA